MLFKPMPLKDASKLYDDIQHNMTPCNFRYNLLDDLVFFTENFTKDYGSSTKKVKYYVEFVDCEDRSSYVIQSKWFDTYKEAHDWFDNDVDFIHDDYDAFMMYAEYDEESDSYGDIEQLEQLFKRSN